MLIKRPRGWMVPDRDATPESVYHDRRRLIKGLAAGPILLSGTAALLAACDESPTATAQAKETAPDPTTDLYPVTRNLRYRGGRPITAVGANRSQQVPTTISSSSAPTSRSPTARRRCRSAPGPWS